MEGLLPAGAGDAAGAAPGRALSTPCKLTKGQVSLERKCYRPRGRARQGRAGQGIRGAQMERAHYCIRFLAYNCADVILLSSYRRQEERVAPNIPQID